LLKAYSFVERPELSPLNSDQSILLEQKRIAHKFLASHNITSAETHCWACDSTAIEPFATLDGIVYQRCRECFSIFASVIPNAADLYQHDTQVKRFRMSPQFQEAMLKQRTMSWTDLIFWVRFRCARFAGKTEGFNLLDVGNPYEGLAEKVQLSGLCSNYHRLKDLPDSELRADVILYFDQLRHVSQPALALTSLHAALGAGGLLFLSTRLGTGFDILTQHLHLDNVFPCEHLYLPSLQALIASLEKCGFEILEFFTPGNLDVENVLLDQGSDRPVDLFMDYLMRTADLSTMLDFQRFLQRNGLSSHARIVARKVR
jgi:hypothetical protein